MTEKDLFGKKKETIEGILKKEGIREFSRREPKESNSAYFVNALQSENYFALDVRKEHSWSGIGGYMFDKDQVLYLGHIPSETTHRIGGQTLGTTAYTNEPFQLESLIEQEGTANLKIRKGNDVFDKIYRVQTETQEIPAATKKTYTLKKL